MKINKLYLSLFIVFSLLLFKNQIQACSMYKVTIDGKTMVGCNEDAWRTTSRIWFKNAQKPNEYGVGFTGSRQLSLNKTAPQSGMNEVGLTFSRLDAYYPKQSNPFPDRIKITNRIDYLTDILHKCGTIKEVKKYIEQYDHSIFFDDVFIYIDNTGKYLIVEPYKLIEGNDPYYILSNFCPSITDSETARKLERYRNGEEFLKTHEIKSSLSFCTALSDTMHICRSRNGDGTLLSSIWNTKNGLINLYFYHSYESTVQFNLNEELAKGDHIINIPELFPENPEFKRLADYKTPFNTPILRVLLVIIAGVLIILTFSLWISLMINKNTELSNKSAILISGMNLLLIAYLFVLATNSYIYYFDAPYKHFSSTLISASSYIPFLLLLVIIPLTYFTLKRLKSIKTKTWIKAILVSTNLVYLILIISFSYWGLYTIWN